jgi:hypothetical protein
MDGLPADIDRGQAGRRDNHESLLRVSLEILEQQRLPRAGFPGDEEVGRRRFDPVEDAFLLIAERNIREID